jgi:hypothetical protein
MDLDDKTAVAPPGWEDSVKRMKKHPEIDNPWALAWHMKNKGNKPHPKKKDAAAIYQAALAAEAFRTACEGGCSGECGGNCQCSNRVATERARSAEEHKTAKEHPSEKARREYLKEHPNADPSDHKVKPESSKPAPKDDGLDADVRKKLKQLSPEARKRVIEKALVNNKAEGDKPSKQKDVSKDKGFEALKGLSPEAQKRVLERALKMGE